MLWVACLLTPWVDERFVLGFPLALLVRWLDTSEDLSARALLRWSAEDLARHSLLSVATVRRAELTEDETSMTAANDWSVRRALEVAGVVFIDENGDGPGVRLAKRSKEKSRK